MIRRAVFRVAVCLLCLTVLLCAHTALPCAAAEGALEDQEGFFFATSLFVGNAALSRENGALVLRFEKGGPILSGKTPSDAAHVGKTACNVLRLTMSNDSACDEVTLTYVRRSDGRTGEVTLPVQPYSESASYDFPLEDAAGISAWSLTFEGVERGTVWVTSFIPLSVYIPDGVENKGTVGRCEYDPATETLTVAGTVRSGVMSANKDAELVVYRIPAGEDPVAWLELSHPLALATSPIANHFEFHISVYRFEDICARYLVCIRERNGNVSFLTSAASVRVAAGESKTASASPRASFKGIGTTRYTDAGGVMPGTAVVEVHLDRLLDADETDFIYSERELLTYLSREYVKRLDDEIRFYTESGCRVLLQFLVDADADEILCAFPKSSAGAETEYRSLRAQLTAEASQLYLTTAFLANRYGNASETPIDGIIVGDRADLPTLYNCAGNLPLSAYVERYAEVLTVIANASASAIPDLELIVPISDRLSANRIDASLRDGRYRSDLFLESLAGILDDRFDTRLTVTLMVVSDRVAYSEEGDRILLYTDPTCLDAGHVDVLHDLLETLPDAIGSRWLYSFLPDPDLPGDVTEAYYADSFYRLQADPDVIASVISFSANERAGVSGLLEAMLPLIRGIDTEDADRLTGYAREKLGIVSWADSIPSYDGVTSVARYLNAAPLLPVVNERDSMAYWDFSKATGTLGWKGTLGYGNLHLSATSRFGRSLTADLQFADNEPGAYLGIDYAFTQPLDVSSADALVLDLGMGSEGVYEVIVQAGNGTRSVTASGTTDGERVVWETDLSGLAECGLRYLRILVRRLDGVRENATLYVHTVSFASDRLDSEKLAMRVRPMNEKNSAGEPERGFSTAAKMFLILIAGAQVVAISLVIRGRKKK